MAKAKNETAALADTIRETQASAEWFIDKKTAEMKANHQSIPEGVCRQLLTARAHHGFCACRAALDIIEKGD